VSKLATPVIRRNENAAQSATVLLFSVRHFAYELKNFSVLSQATC